MIFACKVNLPQGTYETMTFMSDDLPIEEAYKQVLEELEEWSGEVPRCNWWITKIKELLFRRNA